ncbi:MAG: dTDP-4-dehydrorhamnose 3,5-epimerase [Candidatus Wallbacteria bacterium]
MGFIKTDIPDLLIYEPKVFEDNRGYFFESYNADTFKNAGITTKFVQDNQSKSCYGVLRGLHYQLNPYAQTKLVRVLSGKIWDIAVDIRRGSPTYGKYTGCELSAENKRQLLIPHGFAHGFVVLSKSAEVMYKCDAFYNKESEGGIMYNDPEIGIKWPISEKDMILSDKDLKNPLFKDAKINFEYVK